jgi:hypothetical protein
MTSKLKVPAHYAKAPKLSANGRAALAGARLEWDELSPTMQAALIEGWKETGERIPCNAIRLPTREALADRSILWSSLVDSDMTPLGVLVREAGTRTRVEVDDAAA